MRESPLKFPERLFVTGTDTDIGKTIVCAILMSGLQCDYWKPVQSGLDELSDTDWIKDKTELPASHFHPETYRLTLPLSPHASAAHDGITIELDTFSVPKTSNTLIIEGAGGIMVPLNDRHFMVDLIKKTNAHVLLVARSSLGTINHTLLSIESLRQNGLNILGVVLNGEKNPGNKEAIENYGNINVIAQIEPMPSINKKRLQKAFENCFMDLQ